MDYVLSLIDKQDQFDIPSTFHSQQIDQTLCLKIYIAVFSRGDNQMYCSTDKKYLSGKVFLVR